MLPGFRSVPLNDAGALRDAVYEETAAVMIEPIQGEAGVYPLTDEALLAAREACDEVGALLILDEVQTGIGRTGSLWAYEQTPVRPDLITSAKALGGGLPIGACITAPPAAEVLEPGDHGSTFAGGAVASAAALAVLDVVDDPALLRGVRERGAALREALLALDGVREVRGRGLMLGAGLEEGIDAAALGEELLRRGLIVNVPEPGTVRLLPPLTIDSNHIERAVALIGESLLSYAAT
jgi:acetylornithine/N-succinyldiaminopimelate aminotransferase